jgi:N-acetylmuramoyl-L-alanine amidase
MALPTLIDRPSPNHDERPAGQPIDILLLHYTGMQSAEVALARLCDGQARVSAHYLIDEDGSCYRLVREERRAWHAGVSSWASSSDVNGRSIGIELVNPGHEFGYRPFAERQMVRLEKLCRTILARHAIPPQRVLGHSDVAPLRKRDPGELFDWRRLARAGIGLWPGKAWTSPGPEALGPKNKGRGVAELQAALARFGYGIEATGSYDNATEAVVTAFQRHFRPARVDGLADTETQSRLESLLALLPGVAE